MKGDFPLGGSQVNALHPISDLFALVSLSRNVLFTQQLVLFAPQALPFSSHVATLRATLTSRQVGGWTPSTGQAGCQGKQAGGRLGR